MGYNKEDIIIDPKINSIKVNSKASYSKDSYRARVSGDTKG